MIVFVTLKNTVKNPIPSFDHGKKSFLFRALVLSTVAACKTIGI